MAKKCVIAFAGAWLNKSKNVSLGRFMARMKSDIKYTPIIVFILNITLFKKKIFPHS